MASAATTAATGGAGEGAGAGEIKLSPNYVNGEFVPAASGKTIDVIDPATGKVCGKIPRSEAVDVEAAIKAAKAAGQGEWRKTSSLERAALLDKIADAIAARAEELAAIESQDSGKTITMATTVDIPRACSNFRFFAGQIRHQDGDSHAMADAINYTVHQPLGVCGLITPWNLPLYLLSWKVAPALAMGNTVIAKPSELTPRTASILADIIHSVGLPKGVFNLVHGYGGEAAAPMTAHPDVPCISFTGGTATGKLVAAAAAPMFKKLSLELGGKNPTIVFADCDFDKTVKGAVRSAFLNQGQVCLAGSRLFVEAPIYGRFVEAFVKEVKSNKVGDPSSKDTWLGPVSSHAHRDKIESYIALAKEAGGTILCGGDRPKLPGDLAGGAFVNPTVIADLSFDSRPSTEEIFGPVVTVHKFTTEDEVVTQANCVRYGLAGSVWTTNLTRAHRVAQRVDAGILWVNCWLHRDLRTPFGGMKDSGTGREGGKYSLEFYSETKNICIHLG